MKFDVIVIGGGATGVFTALDLTLRGLNVALVERDALASGTSGKFHGMLHSGARYAVNDPESAKECIEENAVISKIAPHTVVDTGGLFVAVTEDDVRYQDELEKGLKDAGIPFKEIPVEDALKMEPNLNPSIKSSLWVPDKVIHAHDLIFSAALTAAAHGALFFTYREVVDFLKDGSTVEGIKVFNKIKNRTEVIKGEMIVNAAGPWSGKIASLAGVEVEVMPTAGVMGVTPIRLVNHIINRMHLPSDADILIPYSHNISIMGTTATVIDDPDNVTISRDDLDLLIEGGSLMVPKLKEVGFTRAYASVRPLLKIKGESEKAGRKATRTFSIFDHEKDGIKGLITISGGKLTTARLMGEKISDFVSEKLGIKEKSKTKEIELLGAKPKEDAETIAKISGLDYNFVKRLFGIIGSVDEERYLPAIRLLLAYATAEVD